MCKMGEIPDFEEATLTRKLELLMQLKLRTIHSDVIENIFFLLM